jgi:hypothetical protein
MVAALPAEPPPHIVIDHHHGWRDDHGWSRDRQRFDGGYYNYGADYLVVDRGWWARHHRWLVDRDGTHLWHTPSGAWLRVHLR